jgi:predicted transposase YdaD
MEWERQRTYDFENGKEAKAIEAAINLLKMKNLSPDEIAQALDLPLEKVLELHQQLLVKV